MALRNARPLRWVPKGVSDTLDGTNAYTGAMSQLKNLIPHQSTAGLYIPRPALRALDWTGGPTGDISVLAHIGSQAYFMSAVAGEDTPFCYDVVAEAFVTVTGANPGVNLPTAWATGQTPPKMELIGTILAITHVGYDGVANFVGWIDISNPAAPVYSAGNVATNPLVGVPHDIAQMTNRAYYAVGNALEISDVNDPMTRTNAAQVLTIGDGTDITGIGPLSLSTYVQGGVVQSLVAFKENTAYQITGDYALTTGYQINNINAPVGTTSPASVAPVPGGLVFRAPDGIRALDLNANVSPPIGDAGQGVALPFIYGLELESLCISANAKVMRVSVKNGQAITAPWQEWWYDLSRREWSGPHTCAARAIDHYGSSFVVAPIDDPTKLYVSDVFPSLTPTYEEFGQPLIFAYQTVLLPDTGSMRMNALIETTLMVALPYHSSVNLLAIDDDNLLLDNCSIDSISSASVLWGFFLWGAGIWGSVSSLAQRRVPWTKPLAFKQMSILITGTSADGIQIGNLYMNFQQLGYMVAGGR